MKTIKNAKSFDELLNTKYGKKGTAMRDEFEMKSVSFMANLKQNKKKAKKKIETVRKLKRILKEDQELLKNLAK